MWQNALENRLIHIPLLSAYGSVMFFICMVLTFPNERVRDIVTVQLERQLGQRYDVEIADLGFWCLMGVSMEGVTLREKVAPEPEPAPLLEGEEEGEGPPAKLPMSVTIDEVAARVAIFPSIFRLGPVVDYRVDLGGGAVHGSYVHGASKRSVSVRIDEVDLRKTSLLTSLLGVPFFGVLDGDVRLELDPKRPLVQSGAILISGKQLTVGPATVQTDRFPPMTYFDIPQTNFGSLAARIKIATDNPGGRPSADIEEFSINGRDLRGELWGDVDLGAGMTDSRARMQLRMQFDEAFVTKNSLAPLMNMGEFRKAKSNSWFGFTLNGPLARMQFKGSPTAAQGAPKGGAAGGEPSPVAPEAGGAPKP